MKIFKQFLASFGVMAMVMFGAVGMNLTLQPTASADVVDVFSGSACGGSKLCATKSDNSVMAVIGKVIQVLIWASAIVSVIVIIVGGLMYMLAAGDPGKITKAKDTVLYAVVGLVVSLLAFAIVYFVTDFMK